MVVCATHCGPVYVTFIFAPDSVSISVSRGQFIGRSPLSSDLSTRLFIGVDRRVTIGTDAVPPTRPLCAIVDSHSPARVPSPGSGKLWVRDHCSTSRYAVPLSTDRKSTRLNSS